MKKHKRRWLALLLSLAVALSALAVGLSLTYAASPYQERFKQPNDYPSVVEKDRTLSVENLGGKDSLSSDPDIATAQRNGINVDIKGVKAGVVSVAMASMAFAQNIPCQVTDSSLLSGYDLANNGEINKKTGDAPFNVNDIVSGYVTPWNAMVDGTVTDPNYQNNSTAVAAKAGIEWSSRNTAVATCSVTGQVGIVAKGTALLVGEFTDRWGVPRSMSVLLGVDTIVGKTLLSDLLDAIKKGEIILGLNPNPYENAGLGLLQMAVNDGKTLLGSVDPLDGDILAAIDAINDAIDALVLKSGGGDDDIIVIPPGDGGPKKLRKTGTPKVYEVLDDDTEQSKVPPEFIYDEDDSLSGEPPTLSDDEKPAYPDGHLFYVEEEPEGSNIWVQIDPETGARTAVKKWGGADGRPGGNGADKDLPAYWNGVKWFAEDPEGSNLWKPVGNPKTTLDDDPGSWIGGGSDGLPDGSNDLYPFSIVNDETVAGPFQPDNYYIRKGPNGRFDTSGDGTGKPVDNAAFGDDEKAYWDGENWTTTPPVVLVAPTISTGSLANGTYNAAYNQTVAASGSTPMEWDISTGSLPSGLSINPSTGAITGTASAAGTYNFTVRATNSVGVNTKPLSIVIAKATQSAISWTSGTSGTVGTPYTAAAGGGSGTGAMSYAITGGTAPGASLSGTTLTVSGAGTVILQAKRAADSNYNERTANRTVTFSDPPTYTISLSQASTLNFGTLETPYTQPAAQSVTITNTGNQATGALTIELSGTNAGSFTLNKTSQTSINAGASDTFTVRPNANLAVGTYAATVTVSNVNVAAKSFNVSFEVKIAGPTEFGTQIGSARKVDGGDGSTWTEIAVNGGYSLIVRDYFLDVGYTGFCFHLEWGPCTTLACTKYSTSNARNLVNSWYAGVKTSTLDAAPIVQYAVDHNAMTKIGNYDYDPEVNEATDDSGISAPYTTKNQTTDIAFLLSVEEASRFCCTQYYNGYYFAPRSTDDQAYINWNSLADTSSNGQNWWLRSPGSSFVPTAVCTVSRIGSVHLTWDPFFGNVSHHYLRPALWVESSIFD
ncbi:MAG: putative Ig domain-containing protein [Oscillospiraceae bacterium]|nr:putative Ig domain-containing protein [Oscillospiraceae bacterium]